MYIREIEVAQVMTRLQIQQWLCRYNIRNYIINDDQTIDVNDDVYISNLSLVRLPIKFGKVTGFFYCHCMSQLSSLYNYPDYVGGPTDVFSPKLKSLKGCPKYIGGNFYINYTSEQQYTKVDSFAPLMFSNIIGSIYVNVKQPDAAYNILNRLGKIG
jgi:hypothetical protein